MGEKNSVTSIDSLSKEPITQNSDLENYTPVVKGAEEMAQTVALIFDTDPYEISTEELSQLIIEDKKTIIAKYNLPPEELCDDDPREYMRQLEAIAKQHDIEIRHKREFEPFFQKNKLAGAVHLGSISTLAVELPKDDDDRDALYRKGRVLVHELIHGLQKKKYPKMNLARQEYEAYLFTISDLTFKTNPWFVLDRVSSSIKINQHNEAWEAFVAEKTAKAQ